MYNNRNYIIFNITELEKIDFSKVLETSQETLRRSINGELSFVKWDGDEEPLFVSQLSSKQGPYSYDEILEILQTSEWHQESP